MHRSLRATGAAILLLLAGMPAGLTTPVAAAVPAPCRVVDATTALTYRTLSAAITKAKAKGKLTVTGTCVGSFTVAKALTIQKGATAAILQGSGGRVLTVSGTGAVTLIGLTIKGGTATDCGDLAGLRCGAGIRNAGNLALSGVTVSANVIDASTSGDAVAGAGIFNALGARLTITGSTIKGNRATGDQATGGGIANRGRLIVLTSGIKGNSVTSLLADSGHAIGGGVASSGETATVVVEDVTLSGNTVTGAAASGAGIAIADGDLELRRSTLNANRANGEGGLGGALFWDSASGIGLVTDTTISGNTAGAIGGGVASTAEGLYLRGATITDNEAPGTGGLDGPADIGATIIAGNRATDVAASDDCEPTPSAVDSHDNLIGDGRGCEPFADGVGGNQVGTHATPLDAKLGILAANGGPTRTHALLTGSPAIDTAGAGDCATDTDQRGTDRPQGAACDIGAFERVP